MNGLSVPDPLGTIRLHAAAYALGLLRSWELPPMADQSLSSGLYSDAMFELACVTSPVMSDVAPLFERMLAELALATPSITDAAWALARRCMELLVHTDQPPWEVLGSLEEIVNAAREAVPDQGYFGSGLDLQALIGLGWSYDEPHENFYEPEQRYIHSEGERHAILDREARAAARAWLERHPR